MKKDIIVYGYNTENEFYATEKISLKDFDTNIFYLDDSKCELHFYITFTCDTEKTLFRELIRGFTKIRKILHKNSVFEIPKLSIIIKNKNNYVNVFYYKEFDEKHLEAIVKEKVQIKNKIKFGIREYQKIAETISEKFKCEEIYLTSSLIFTKEKTDYSIQKFPVI